MVTQTPKAVFSTPEQLPSATAFGRVGMVLLLCAALFSGCGGGDPRLKEALENIQNPDEAFRLQGIKTFLKIGEKAKLHADKIAALLKDTSPKVRGVALSVLRSLNHSSPEIVQDLVAMANGDKDVGVRIGALSALSGFGAQEEFSKAGKAILAGDDADLKIQAIMEIHMSGKESVTALKAELEAIAGGSDARLAGGAKAALKTLE